LVVLSILASACGARSGLDVDAESGSPLPAGAPARGGNGNGGGARGGNGNGGGARGGNGNGGGAPASAGAQTIGAGGSSAGAPSKPAVVTAIAAGTDTTCALKDDGTVWCWGGNAGGQLGNGTITTRSWVPVQVEAIDSAVAIAAGGDWIFNGPSGEAYLFNCAVLRDGDVQCWGRTPGGPSAVPVFVSGVHDAVAVAGGLRHACAVRNRGPILCWGRNDEGQLGNGSLTSSVAAVEVLGISHAKEVRSLGSSSTCALSADVSIKCWGDLGFPTSDASLGSTPVLVPLEYPPPAHLAAGYGRACAVFVDGTVLCWRGTEPPAAVPLVGKAQAVAVGNGHACVLLSGGTIQCWGEGAEGQLGYTAGPTITVAGIHDAVAVSAGAKHSCALLMGGAVWCWGSDDSGQLGIGEQEWPKLPHYTPERVLGL